MKIQLMSDLHLEFDGSFRPTNYGSDTLILSGDVCVARALAASSDSPYHKMGNSFRDFFKHCSDNFKNVMYIKGNHEHYNSRFNNVSDIIRGALAPMENIHFLDDEYVDVESIRFVGSTLWTDNNKNCPITEMSLRGGMNDYHVIQYLDPRGNYRRLTPNDTALFHAIAKTFIKEAIPTDFEGKAVVMSHHAPSAQSINEKYKDDHYFNGGYFSSLDYFIADIPQIALWTHGHMHDATTYNIDDTIIACNPRGYPGQSTGFEEAKIFEI